MFVISILALKPPVQSLSEGAFPAPFVGTAPADGAAATVSSVLFAHHRFALLSDAAVKQLLEQLQSGSIHLQV